MSEEKKVAVKFVKNHTPYIEGDVAGVTPEEAKEYEKLGVAKKAGKKK